MTRPSLLFDFSTDVKIDTWQVVGDPVMGGLSAGRFSINSEGHGCFQGTVSLANNGGFSLVRHRFEPRTIAAFTKVHLRLKGDGKTYRFRVKSALGQRHSYVAKFETSGEWETMTVPFSQMVPTFRGRVLDLPNYPGNTIAEIAFFIGNKKEESFALEIDSLSLH